MSNARVVVVALDAATPQLLRALSAAGRMPHLRRMIDGGLSGDIRGLDGFYIGSTWPSFCTGTDPGRHGFHYQTQLVPGSYRLRPVEEGEPTRVPPFWKHLSDAGRRVAVLDVPLTRLDPQLNGVQVVEWGVHDDLYGFGATPAGLEQRIVDRYGRHPIGGACDGHRTTAADYDHFARQLIDAVSVKTRLTLDVLAQQRWDFLIQVFSESHCAGHQCWHLHDPAHPGFDARLHDATGDPVERVYGALDAAIGAIAEGAAGATLVVMSAHGMTSWYGATFLVRDVLAALGATTPLAPAAPALEQRGGLGALARAAWRALPAPMRRALGPLRDRWQAPAVAPAPLLTRGFDAARSRCFPVQNGLGTVGIRLNVAGREPTGVLQPGAEVDAFVAALTDDLRTLVDADSGQPVIDRVLRVQDLCAGPALEVLPDLVIEWNRRRPVGSTRIAGGQGARVRISHPRFGVVEGMNSYGRTGEHEPDGFFVATGPAIEPGKLAQPVSLLDFAPTICALLDCRFDDGDGRRVDALCSAAVRSRAA